ncbi:unnamed protein product, partial [marine sediment metagenome]
PYYLLDSIKVEREIKSKDFEIKTKKDCKKALARVIGAIDGQITSEFIKAELEVEDGNVLRDLKNDIFGLGTFAGLTEMVLVTTAPTPASTTFLTDSTSLTSGPAAGIIGFFIFIPQILISKFPNFSPF